MWKLYTELAYSVHRCIRSCPSIFKNLPCFEIGHERLVRNPYLFMIIYPSHSKDLSHHQNHHRLYVADNSETGWVNIFGQIMELKRHRSFYFIKFLNHEIEILELGSAHRPVPTYRQRHGKIHLCLKRDSNLRFQYLCAKGHSATTHVCPFVRVESHLITIQYNLWVIYRVSTK
jgi:hypothetical protein